MTPLARGSQERDSNSLCSQRRVEGRGSRVEGRGSRVEGSEAFGAFLEVLRIMVTTIKMTIIIIIIIIMGITFASQPSRD